MTESFDDINDKIGNLEEKIGNIEEEVGDNIPTLEQKEELSLLYESLIILHAEHSYWRETLSECTIHIINILLDTASKMNMLQTIINNIQTASIIPNFNNFKSVIERSDLEYLFQDINNIIDYLDEMITFEIYQNYDNIDEIKQAHYIIYRGFNLDSKQMRNKLIKLGFSNNIIDSICDLSKSNFILPKKEKNLVLETLTSMLNSIPSELCEEYFFTIEKEKGLLLLKEMHCTDTTWYMSLLNKYQLDLSPFVYFYIKSLEYRNTRVDDLDDDKLKSMALILKKCFYIEDVLLDTDFKLEENINTVYKIWLKYLKTKFPHINHNSYLSIAKGLLVKSK